ncbi:MAG: hypothetical protein IJB36_03970 [Clostridia bacterium]|nr:hypothetical protein [Clostridia bacterium]
MSENPIIEQYRQTLEALHKLREKYIKKWNLKMVRVLDEEIDEVARTLDHLTKGEKRWKWESE